MDKRIRYHELIRAMQACAEAYVAGTPQVSDPEYDAMMKELRSIEAEHPELITSDSPTQRVMEEPAAGFVPAEHRSPMLSLENAFSAEDLQAFTKLCATAGKPIGELEFVVQPKVDGLPISLIYEKGVLVRAVTRGNGRCGDVVTEQALMVRGVRPSIPTLTGAYPFSGLVEIRGEVFLSKYEFTRLNREAEALGEEPYANPRNTAVGAMKSLDPLATYAKGLRFAAFELMNKHEVVQTEAESMEVLQQLGFMCPGFYTGIFRNDPDWAAIIEAELKTKQVLPFVTDGLVIKLNDLEMQRVLGRKRNAPVWAIAFKFPPKQVRTKLKSVTFQLGRYGDITPVAELEPVQVDGTLVSRATLHNFDHAQKLDLRVGDVVTLCKAGEIIPQILGSVLELRDGSEFPISPPERCPCCQGLVRRELTGVDETTEGTAWMCDNYRCPDVVMRRLEHLVSKEALDVKGVGPSALAKVATLAGTMARHLIGADLFKVSSWTKNCTPEQAARIMRAFEVAKSQHPARLLYGLSIPFVGRTVSRAVLAEQPDLMKLLETARNAPEGIPAIPGVGMTALKSLQRWLEERGEELEFLLEEGCNGCVTPEVPAGQELTGETWVITGTLSQPRDHFAALIRSHGGTIGSAVSKNTTYLLAGDKAGGKIKKAEQLGVTVVAEEDLMKRIA